MAPPVLLVADDLSTIAAVKRVLGREGYEVILATSAADAVIAWGHHLPGLVVLQPSVESDRGAVVLEELQQHPDAQLLRVVLLGEAVPGFSYEVEPLPLDGAHFAKTVEVQRRAAEPAQDWTVSEPPTDTSVPQVPVRLDEPEPWRATRPSGVMAAEDDAPRPEAAPTPPDAGPADDAPVSASPSVMTKLFGDLPSLEDELHKDVEAQVMASVESSLPRLGPDDAELQRLEDEVRAEAARRRAARESQAPAITPPPIAPVAQAPTDAPATASDEGRAGDETSFADLGTTPPDGAADPTGDETPTATVRASPAAPLDTATAREVLARAEAISLESRAVSQSQQKTAEAEARRVDAELEALRRRAEHAEALVRREREARAGSEDQLEQARDEARQLAAQLDAERTEAQQRFASDLEAVTSQAEARRADLEASLQARLEQLEQALAAQTDELDARGSALAKLTQQLEQTEGTLDAVNATAVERAAERESLLSSLTHEQEAARRFEERCQVLETERSGLQKDLKDVRGQLEAAAARVRELTAQLDDERLARLGVEEQRDELTHRLAAAVTQESRARADADAAMKLASEVEGALATTKGELESVQTDLGEVRTRLEAAVADVATLTTTNAGLEARLTAASGEAERLRNEGERLRAQQQALEADLAVQGVRAAAAERDVAAAREGLELQRARADEAEALAQLSGERLKALEHRQVMNLALPGRRALGVPRHGTVSLDQLAALVSTLVSAQADVRLELGVRGGTRTLWFKKGALHGAESSFDHESLIDRARRDGLIDARQEAELRLLRTATASEQLDAMKARGVLRDIESVPLLQRATEHVALEAFSEESTQYRLSDEPPPSTVLLVAVPRSTLPLLAEALRRAVPTDALLERLGGADAVCLPTENDVDLRAMGFSDKERKMLSWVDGEATVEDLALASGLKSEASFRALLVAKLLGVIEVKPPAVPAPAPSPDLDVRRLEAKYDEVQDADYFTILGLTRGASSDDVQRAFRRLAEEFDPLKYTGHPDASLQQRAQVVSSLIEEAARALEDERRRAEYARHLLD
jgi:hypothetical protein